MGAGSQFKGSNSLAGWSFLHWQETGLQPCPPKPTGCKKICTVGNAECQKGMNWGERTRAGGVSDGVMDNGEHHELSYRAASWCLSQSPSPWSHGIL